MHSRKVRVSTAGVPVSFGPGTGALINVSLTGALMELDHEVVVDETLPLRVGPIEIHCKVVRCDSNPIATQSPNRRAWLVAVTFVDLASATEKLIRDLVAGTSQRSGTLRA
jgi:hypothetical protein